ncbi:MAG: alpha-L-fucosidase [Omnitrophica WOR_2 bacterium]
MLNLHAPAENGDFRQVKAYIELDPEPDYRHASEEARQAFMDFKYGIRIHWGLYTLWNLQGESWPFLRMSFSKRQAYQQLYQTFNPVDFDAGEWMDFFQKVGIRCMAFTSKHHEGFSMFDTAARVKRRINWTMRAGPQIEDCDLAYSVMETPFKRDIVKELCQAAQQRGILIDLYFSHPDWYDADFRPYGFHPLQTQSVMERPEDYGDASYDQWVKSKFRSVLMSPERTPEETVRMIQRHRTQLVELLSNYGKIDMLCLDIFLGKDVWPQMRETVKLLRQIQPDIMLRIRGIGNYGDYYTPEGFIPGDRGNTDMPWMVIYPLGKSFSYEPSGRRYKGARWIVRNLVDTVAKGGNFMPGIGPDATGRFHPQAIQNLEEAGEWLRVNGEAIYSTRPCDPWCDGPDIRFTRSKDGGCTYAIFLSWPGRRARIQAARPVADARLTMLGVEKPLQWRNEASGVRIEIPEEIQKAEKRPCPFAWTVKIEGSVDFVKR